MLEKEEAEAALTTKLDEAKRLIVLNHRKGFKKAQCQIKVLVPSFEFTQSNVNCDVVYAEIIRES